MKRSSAASCIAVLLILCVTSLVALLGATLHLRSNSGRGAITLRAADRGHPLIRFQDGRDVAVRYTAADQASVGNVLALTQGQARALSLASADFNLDGFPDLVAGYASSGRGLVTLHRGNPEAFAPTKQQTIDGIINNQYPDPFLTQTTVLWTPEPPEFLATGDFDRDGRLDILAGARGSGALYLLAGDGNQGFHEPRAVPLPGPLTTLAEGQKSQTDGSADVVVGIVGRNGPALVVYDTQQGVLAKAASTYPLPAAATFVTMGRLDEDGSTDVAIIAGNGLYILHEQDHQAVVDGIVPDEEGWYLEPIALPFGVRAVAVSDFIWDRDARLELAVAAEDGRVHIVTRGALDTRPLTVGEVQARRQLVAEVRRANRPVSDLVSVRPYRALTWQVAETTRITLSRTSDRAQPLLMSTLASGQQSHDLLVVNPGARQLQIAFRTDARPGRQGYAPVPARRETITFDASSEPVAALPMRLSVHGLPGFVVLREGKTEPAVVLSEATTFTVNTAADTDDAAAGNGTCADSGGNCSLRAAVQESNVLAGLDTITFAAGLNGVPIQLTQAGDDNAAAQGDLDINSDITIMGNGAANTIIQGSSNAAFTGSMGDKAIGINQDGTFSTLSVSISGLTVRFTRNSNPNIGTFTETGGALDIFLTGTGAMPGPTTTLTNTTFDSNANQNSYGGAINIDSGDLMGGTNIFRGTVQITGSTISNNDTLNAGAAATGGGINLFADRHNVTLSNSTITGNQTSANIGSNGGGLNIRHSFGGTVTLNSCTISSNISGSDGGGIMIAGVGGQTVNMTGGSLTGNTAQGTGAEADGGGLFNANPVGGTTLSGVTISNNTATAGANARGGGVHDGANSPLTINNCTITGNASDIGGGVATTNAFVNQLTTITNSTISGNSATLGGGALFIVSGSLMANLNRIVSNTAPTGSGIWQTGGTANVENNWWGCDGFPNSPGCQTGSGTFDADPRVDLRLLPPIVTLAPGGTQAFTSNVNQNTNAAAINPVVLNGLTVTFSGGGLGSVSPITAALSGLTAGTVFTASSSCPVPNTGTVSATLDSGTQTSSVTLQQAPAISACPANQTVNTNPGTCTALVSFTPPTATAGCPAPTVTTRIGATPITSPHAFPVGTTTANSTASNGVAPDASCSFTVTVNDVENPAITCPANISATENPPGSGSTVVTYTAPVGTDACAGATTVQTAGLASGNAFPVGLTTNTFRVTDAAGNQATCSFTVTVVLPPDLSLTKSHTGNFRQGQTGATYTLTATNTGGSPTSGTVTVADNVPAGLTPSAAGGTGWNCGIVGAMVNCTRSDALASAASYPPITLTVNVAPNAPPSVTNTATISGGGDVNTANNTASDVTTILPGTDLTISKSHAGNFIQGQPGTYTVTVSNVGGSPTSGSVTVLDELPAGLVPTTTNGTGWTCSIAGQGVSCVRSDPLAPGQSYPAITLMVGVQPNAPASVTNTATVFGGGEANPSNNTAADPTTITAGPNLIITKGHTGDFAQGQTGTYTLTVSNTGASPTSGTISVTDSLPSGLASTAATGAGWSCAPGGQSVTCTRSDPLASGTSSPITLTVQVAANAPASVTNTVMVAGGGDVDSSNNSASDPTTIIAVPDLTITKVHTGSFLQGQVGATYTLTVTNIGGGPTSSPVTVGDTLPAGLTPTAAAGGGWVCNIAGQSVSCSRSDALNVGASYPAITLTVNVAPAAPPSVTNTAMISGGGDVNTTNNTATDVTTILPGPDLIISKSHAGNFTQGHTAAQFTVTATNSGGSPTSGVVTVVDNVPAGLTLTAATGTGWTCGVTGTMVNCSRSDPLAPGASYGPVTLTVDVAPNAPASVTNTATVSGGGDINTTNNTAADVTTILPGPDLTISKSHAGSFIQGQTGAQFTVTVINSGGSPTSGAVTVVDSVPTGLIPTAASGTGWNCGVTGATVNCTRSDPLAPGASYGPVTMTVDVAPNAPPSETNTATVSGGGDINTTNNTASDVATILPGPDLTIAKSHVGSFTAGQTGAQFTVTVTNVGGSPTSGAVTLIDNVPAGLTPTAGSGAGWTCGISGAMVNCGRSDPLAPGASYGPITLTVNIAPTAPASVTNTATISGGGDVNPSNNTATDVATIGTSQVDLAVTKTDGRLTYTPGAAISYTITVTNAGPSTAAGFSIADNVPATITGVSVTCAVTGTGNCGTNASSGNDVSFTAASLAPGTGNTLTLTIDGTVSSSASGPLVNTATVAAGAGATDVNPGNNSATDTNKQRTGVVTEVAGFFAYDPAFTGGVSVAAGDVNGDGVADVITGAGAGGGPHVRAFSLAGGTVTEIASFFAYDPAFAGGISVAVGDVTGDGVAEIITGAGIGGGPHVRAFSLAGDVVTEVASFFAYDPGFAGGVLVAVGDVTGDGVAEIITGPGIGGPPHVRAFGLEGGGPSEIASFDAYDPAFTGGVTVAAADVTGDGVAEIITGAGPGGGPHVRAFDLAGGGTEVTSFFAYDPAFTGGVHVTAGDVTGDVVAEIITGAGPGGGPHVRALSFTGGLAELVGFFAYDAAFGGGVVVAAQDVTGDGVADIITGAGPGGGPHVRVLDVSGVTVK